MMSKLYFVQELLAVFALFSLGFAAIALVVASLYTLQHCWELAVVRLADFRRPVMNVAPVTRENQKAAYEPSPALAGPNPKIKETLVLTSPRSRAILGLTRHSCRHRRSCREGGDPVRYGLR